MRMLRIPGLVAIVLAMTTAAVLAHQVTYKGTVIAVEKESVRVTVIDDKTKKPVAMKFDFDKETKILRGDKRVTIAEARIVKDEKIAVTIDHDVDETLAIVIRLDEKK
jgi:hypothetical protein